MIIKHNYFFPSNPILICICNYHRKEEVCTRGNNYRKSLLKTNRDRTPKVLEVVQMERMEAIVMVYHGWGIKTDG